MTHSAGLRDLSYPNDDVVAHGQAIFGRLKAGITTCDGAWLADFVALFECSLAESGNG